MSRAAAAQQSSSVTPTPSALLVLRNNPNGSSTALLRSEPFGSNGHPVDIGALVMLLGLSEYSDKERIENRKKYLDSEQSKRKKKFRDYVAFTSHGGGIFKITSYLVWIRILNFLLHHNAFQPVPLVISPEHFPSIDDQLNDLQSHALQTVRSATNLTVNFFSKNYEAGFELACLLDSALNADLKTVTEITTTMHPNKLRRLLSTEHGTGKATTHLGRITVEHTGAPLQMAIYDHDEEMVAYFKEKMDPPEFDRQSKVAFKTALTPEKCAELDRRNATSLEYHQAMLEQQNKDAETLCTGLEDAFKSAQPSEFTVDNNYVASAPTTQLPVTIGAFIDKLTDYVQKNPVHNPYILQRVYEIYSRLPSNFYRDCFFSQKVIGGVQSFLSARWLQHYAQGIDYLAENNEVPRRSFICRASIPSVVDVRHLVSSCIGRDSFLSMVDRHRARVFCVRYFPVHFIKFMSNKNSKLSELITPRVQTTHSCVIQ